MNSCLPSLANGGFLKTVSPGTSIWRGHCRVDVIPFAFQSRLASLRSLLKNKVAPQQQNFEYPQSLSCFQQGKITQVLFSTISAINFVVKATRYA